MIMNGTKELLMQQQQAQQMFRQKQLLAQQQLRQQPMSLFQQQMYASPHPSTVAANQLMHPPTMVLRNQSSGQAVLRLLQFAEQLSPGPEKAIDRKYWDNFIDDFFTPNSILKLGLFNSSTQQQKAFEIVNNALQARFFYTQYQCSTISMQMTLEKTMEYILPGGIMNVECPRASILQTFDSQVMVISTGHLWVQFLFVQGTWKIAHLDFMSNGHEQYLLRATVTKKKIPESPVNEWGVPPRVFHVLQISQVMAPKMSEIIFHSLVSAASPRDSLSAIAFCKSSPTITVKTQMMKSDMQTPTRKRNNSLDAPPTKKKNRK